MKKLVKRLEKPEQKAAPVERQFVTWGNSPAWTEEEKAEAIRKNPEERIFWRSLLECFPINKEE